jgi:glutamyl-tRNA synthetase
MPEPPPSFTDVLHGEVDASAWGGDFVVHRVDGLFAYQLAVVVDDIEMAITEVVRGDDLLSSTPRQIALHRALGHEPPAFLHVPLVLGADGQRLAKRHGAVAVRDHRARGRKPGEVVGALAASLGLAEPGEALSPRELVPRFDVARLPREPVTLPV